MNISQILSKARLVEILDQTRQGRVGVVGDFALDAYWMVDMKRSQLSRETPHFPRPVVDEIYSPGAGGNVAHNLAALGVKEVTAFGVIGEDAWGDILLEQLSKYKIATHGLIPRSDRHTLAYIKPILMGYDSRQEDARFDFENRQPLSPQAEERLLKKIEDQLEQLDAVLISDQMDENGTITPRLRQRLGELADRQPEIRFLVDSRRRIGLFRNMILKPNLMEAMAEIEPGNGIGEVSAGRLEEAGKALSRGVQQPVFLTLGERGVLVCTADQCQTIPAAPVQGPLDIVGAGDAFFAGLAASLVTGCSVWEAGAIANLAAAVTVEKVGQTGTATPEEIVERFEKAVKTL